MGGTERRLRLHLGGTLAEAALQDFEPGKMESFGNQTQLAGMLDHCSFSFSPEGFLW